MSDPTAAPTQPPPNSASPTAAFTSTPAPLAYHYPPPPTYPPTTPHLHKSPIAINATPETGRGVYATEPIPAGTLIDISPVLLLSDEEYYGRRDDGTPCKAGELRGVEGSQLRGYVFTWKGKEGGMALALGMGSLFNHSIQPNVTFQLNTASYTISYTTFKPAAKDEELCIFYGHQTHFTDASASPTTANGDATRPAGSAWTAEDDAAEKAAESDPLAGLGTMLERSVKAADGGVSKEERRKRWEGEVVPFEECGWAKVTEEIDPEDMPLTLMPCWTVAVPAMRTRDAFQFARKFSSTDSLAHLKRVKSTAGPGESQAATTKYSIIEILLFPTSVLAASELEAALDAAPLKEYLAEPTWEPELIDGVERGEREWAGKAYVTQVPAGTARTQEQVDEWGRVWPVQIVHLREGAGAKVRQKGWARAKSQWLSQQAEAVWRAAKEAGEKGEHPIVCVVSESWDSDFHSTAAPPTALVRTHDTRLSSGNTMLHAASNAIDAIGLLDTGVPLPLTSAFTASPTGAAVSQPYVSGASVRPACASLPADPYLLTGLTVFMSHEPCLLCSMSLLHSRIKELYFVRASPGAGGCGSVFRVHEDGGLNHRFEVFRWEGGGKGMGGVGEGLEVEVDP